jgi:murein DD-endopeptidase MepM/ murein hydrolase activator NlpD
MSLRGARAIAYGVVALLAVVAIVFISPLPPRSNQPAGEIISEQHEAHVNERHDIVGKGETLVSVLARGGISELLARELLKAAKTLDPRRIPAGMIVRTRTAAQDTVPSEVILQLAIDRLLHLRRVDSTWIADEERLPWKTDTVVVAGIISTNLYDAVDSAARDALPSDARQMLTWSLADIFEYRVDMSRDLQVGDAFRVLAERSVGPQGAVRIGNVIAAIMKLSGTTTEAVRFHSAKVGGDFFDQTGKSMRAGFLRAPLQFRRISSVFGMRKHPILGVWKQHQGTDYAADAGTPVRAIGDGTVLRAGWNNGYGNLIEIRHANGFVTRYGHMRGFAQGVHAGSRVTIGSTIGYVGMTGLATAPHLHFEVLVKGEQRDPRTSLRNASSDPIPAAESVAFADARTRVLALIESPARLASAEPVGGAVKQAGTRQ